MVKRHLPIHRSRPWQLVLPLASLLCGGAVGAATAWTNPYAMPSATPRQGGAPSPEARTRQTRAPTTPGLYLDKSTLALGEALTLTVIRPTAGAGSTLEALDLSPLEHDFEIQGRTRGTDAGHEQLTLTLYPRRVGKLTLPALGFPGRTRLVNVTDGSDQVPRVRVSLDTDPVRPVVRHSALLTLEACTAGTLRWQRPVLVPREGYSLRPLGESEVVTERDGQRCSAQRWHWALLPTATGRLQVVPPVLTATRFGVPLRFPAPVFEVTATPVPSWLPLDVAVGPVGVEPVGSVASASVGQPLPTRFMVDGDYAPQALLNLLQAQLATHPAWVHYPPVLKPVPGRTPVPRHEVTLYGLPSESGVMEQPALRWPWFDPISGELRQVELPPQRIEVADPGRDRMLRWLSIVGAALALVAAAVALWRSQSWRWRRWRMAGAVPRCGSVDELHRTILAFGLTGSAPPATTLGVWRERMEGEANSQELGPLVDTLARARYGREAPAKAVDASEVPALTPTVLRWLRSLRPRRPVQRTTSAVTARKLPSGNARGIQASTVRATPEPEVRNTP